ncbi:thiamine-phosphate kinase [candidate division LCP-89 bacterium B3_LCP]|uniref:Thiamine-monophosphate kinase n=1 Tax=candidate division LCP-89 bacterium B3_LCP TaxID=2012998 RepID=A0A532URU2_UNCL8|nr:MAG: thiamine-phosphate kinase [candidate division LCP-89 bacterium B3_LCP]
MKGEFELIDRLIQGWKFKQDVKIPPGDDSSAVIIEPTEGTLLLQTTDILVENVHFRREWGNAYQLGWKSLAVNLSDIAAMGGKPKHAHLSLAIPQKWSEESIIGLRDGFKALADIHEVDLIGGDLSLSKNDLLIAVSLNGIVHEDHVIRRKGANPGDVIWVSSYLGDAAAGLRCLQNNSENKGCTDLISAFSEPHPEIELGLLCAESAQTTAMIDISDGLAGDLGHILKASDAGAVLVEADLPISETLQSIAIAEEWDTTQMALYGGEDYRLLGCTGEQDFDSFASAVSRKLGRTIYAIGTITKDSGLRLKRRNGSIDEINPTAHDHFK